MLKVEGVTRRFGGLTAVDRVSFEVGSTGLTALVGPNGAGKSTLFNLIGGLFPPSEGKIYFQGEEISQLPAHERVRRGIGKNFQLVSVFPGLSIRNHLWLTDGSNRRAEQTRGILAELGLSEKLDTDCSELTISEKKRLELAMVLSLDPKLLLLDEVFAGLMSEEVEQMKKVIIHWAGMKAILFIEHRMDILMELASRVIVMVRGAVIADGTPAEVRANSLVQKAYLREEH